MQPDPINDTELTAFEIAIFVACVQKSPQRLEHALPGHLDVGAFDVPEYFRAPEGSLVISFDAAWCPFLCNTRGYNLGPKRWYIPKTSKLLARVARELQSSNQRRIAFKPGGRVFLDAQGAWRHPDGHPDIEVLR